MTLWTLGDASLESHYQAGTVALVTVCPSLERVRCLLVLNLVSSTHKCNVVDEVNGHSETFFFLVSSTLKGNVVDEVNGHSETDITSRSSYSIIREQPMAVQDQVVCVCV